MLLDLSDSDAHNTVIQRIGEVAITGDYNSSIYLMELDDKVELLLQYQVESYDPYNGTVTQSGFVIDERTASLQRSLEYEETKAEDEHLIEHVSGVQLISSEFDRIPTKHSMMEKMQVFLNEESLIRAWDSKTMNPLQGKDYSKAFWMPFHDGPDVPVHTISLANKHLLMKEVVGADDFEIPPMKLEFNEENKRKLMFGGLAAAL
ncbi:MAG: hypothetical protein EOP45_18000, partial [Sphingobacteriaceae bacterium]